MAGPVCSENDDFIRGDSDEAVTGMRRIAQRHGCFVGPSSAGHLIAAKRLRERNPELKSMATLFRGEDEIYLSEYVRLHDLNV